jgi:hypothetical protein
LVSAFHKGLSETGYVEGRNLAVELRSRSIAALADPPPPRKIGSKRAPEIWFSRALSRFFNTTAGRPMDATVEQLTVVTFDLEEDLDKGIAKKRRRTAGEHYRKKTK